LWKTLARESVVFTAERRIGKTTVMKKMEAEPPPGMIVLFSDLEKVESPIRFVETLLTDLKKHLTRRATFERWFGTFMESIGGVEVGGIIKLPQRESDRDWQSVLEKTLTDACRNQADSQLVFLWDEIPYMLQKISALERESGSNDNSALAILDCLRAMRSEIPNLRMLFTGSVGLHHVLSEIRGSQVASQPANDMAKIDIGPLTLDDAARLARELLNQEEIECLPPDAVVEQLIHLTDCVPFYIHRVITRLAILESAITPETVESMIKRCLTDPADPWEMEHFRDRLKIYYRGSIPDAQGTAVETAAVAKMLLNNIAVADEPRSIDQCHADLKARLPIENRDLAIQLLNSLAKDHYLLRDDDGKYAFRFPLLRRWWVMAEGLGG
jgi:hypothetical protein